jgi:hypothetical protein
MFRFVLKYLSYLAMFGIVSLAFLLIAQVNLDDLRLKVGNLRVVSDPFIKVGGFYSILPDGSVNGPYCMLTDTVLSPSLEDTELAVSIVNKLGSSLPVLSRWTANLFDWTGLDSIVTKEDPDQPEVRWQGYALDVAHVRSLSLSTSHVVHVMIDGSYNRNPDCEKTVNYYIKQGDCVQIIVRVVEIGSQKIGYKLADDRCLIVDSVDAKPIRAPNEPLRLTARLSVAKERLGLLDNAISQVDALRMANGH